MTTAASRSQELGADVWTPDVVVDLFVNASPASEHPLEEADNFLNALQGAKIVFDHEMPGRYLEKYCADNSIFHIKGLDMYYPQMYAQWALFLKNLTDSDVDIPELIRKADAEL
jgi:hypothetical protein